MAKANENVVSEFIRFVTGLQHQYEELSKKQNDEEPSIENA